MAIGRVISLDSGVYKILGENNEEILLKARGSLRHKEVSKDSSFNKSTNKYSKKVETKRIKLSPKVGDLVLYECSLDTYFLDDVLPRKNELIRPDIANVDQIMLIFSAKRPDLSYFLLDTFISNLELHSIKPLIVITKIDLLSNEEITKLYTDTYRSRMPLYNDYVFHRIYGSDTEESRAALIGLLNIILERKNDPIRHIEITNPIDLGDWILDKESVMDIKAKADSGELLTIEMQVSNLADYRCRTLFYGGRLVNSSLKSGESYDMMKKSIVVSIIQNKLFPKEIGCHSIFDVREQKTGLLLSDRLAFHFLELGKVDPQKPVEEMTQIEKLAVYLRYANDENYKDSVQEICESEEGIIMAENLYRHATKEEREAAWAECRMMYQHDQASLREDGRKEGHRQGLAEGAAQKQREIAKNLKDLGMDTNEIIKATGLCAEEVAKL